jgi:carbon-monoxide dehydrogenase medium subunit
MARPSVLVDVNRIPGLAGVHLHGDGVVRVGALTRHAALTRQTHHPLLAEAARWIGHTAIRTRGTTGGSIAHADPSAELPVVAVGTGATVTVAGPATTRTVAAEELFEGALMTSLADDEMIVDVRFPVPARWGFAEFTRRHGDFALVAAVVAEVSGQVRIAMGGVGAVPVRATAGEQVLAAGGSAREAAAAAAADGSGRQRRTLPRLRREVGRIARRDYFPPPERERAREAVEVLAQALEVEAGR